MKRGFMGQVVRKRGIRQAAIKEIKTRNLPVVIYGAGLTGNNIHDYLKQNNVPILGFMVDKGYGENTVMCDLPVKLLKYYDDEYEAFCVIIAIQNVERAVENLRKFNSAKMKDVYVLCAAPAFLGLVYDYDYIQLHQEAFETAYSFLADDISMRTMLNYVNSIVANQYNLNRFRNLYDPDQYFAKDILSLTENEVFVDCGAYNGDTLLDFMKHAPNGKCRRYYALEPDEGNCVGLRNVITENGLRNVEIITKGAWDTKATLKFTGGAGSNAGISSTGSVHVEVDSIDNLLFSGSDVTFIKMDVQGVELKALQGAVKTIRRDHPALAICVYHKPQDLFEIPLYIKSLVPEYKLYLRHHAWSLIETVLYAVEPKPRQRT